MQTRLTGDCKLPLGVLVCPPVIDWRPGPLSTDSQPNVCWERIQRPATLCGIKVGIERNGWIIDFVASVWCRHIGQKERCKSGFLNYTIVAY